MDSTGHDSHAWIDGDYHRCGACGAEMGTDEGRSMCSFVLPFVLAEREACAEVAESYDDFEGAAAGRARCVANAIRARK
jgi:hypothetical protein